MKKLKQLSYRMFLNLPIKERLLITYLFLSSFILLVTAFSFYNISKQVLIRHAVASSLQQLTIINNNLREKLNHITDYAITLSINSELTKTLKENPTVPDNELDRFFVNSDLTKQAQRIIGLHRNIDYWDILDTENNWFHSSSKITDQLDAFLTEEDLHSLHTDPSFRLTGPFMMNDEAYFVALKPIMDLNTTKYLGTVVLLIRESNISSIFRDLPDSQLKNFYIINNHRIIASSATPNGLFQDFSSYIGIDSKTYSNLTKKNHIITKIDKSDHLLIYKSFPGMDWYVVNVIPLKNLTVENIVLLKNILFISVLLFILSLFFSIVSTRTVTSPINRLARKMEAAAEGNLSITASYQSNDEIAILYKQFNIMITRIDALLKKIYAEQEAKQFAELKLLQAQINPHFLYNTISTIKSLIELDMPDTAISALTNMSGFYRNSLSKGKFIISLAQELELTRQYLYIQNVRFMEYIEYDVRIDTQVSLEHIRVPKLTLQPIIENIFVHALSTEKCLISLTVFDKDDSIYIEISDNGVGIEEEKLKELCIKLSDDETDPNSFGLPSIHHRLRLQFGPPYGLSIESQKGEYTKVTIFIPQGGDKEYENPGYY